MAEDDAQAADQADQPKKKGSKTPLLVGLVLALLAGGGGFYAVRSGLIGGGGGQAAHAAADPAPVAVPPMPDVSYVAVDPLVIGLGGGATGAGFLRFKADLEVNAAHADEVHKLMPRIVDVLNGYLRAVDPSLLADRTALVRLRSQMLRRIQIVTGEGRVRDLLIQEFVLNG